MSINLWMIKMWYIHVTEYYSTVKRNEALIHATTWMNLGNMMLGEIVTKDPILYNFIYMKCPKYCQIFRDREISGCLAGDETQ